MYEIEAMVTRTGPTVLKLTADWPVDWLRASGIRTIEIQRELVHGEYLELPSVPTERADLDGNRVNWPKLWVGNRVVVRCFFPGETEPNTAVPSLPFQLGRTLGDGCCDYSLSATRGSTTLSLRQNWRKINWPLASGTHRLAICWSCAGWILSVATGSLMAPPTWQRR